MAMYAKLVDGQIIYPIRRNYVDDNGVSWSWASDETLSSDGWLPVVYDELQDTEWTESELERLASEHDWDSWQNCLACKGSEVFGNDGNIGLYSGGTYITVPMPEIFSLNSYGWLGLTESGASCFLSNNLVGMTAGYRNLVKFI